MRVDEIYFRVGNGEGNWKGREFYKEKRRFVSVIPLFTFSTENVTFASLSLLFFFSLFLSSIIPLRCLVLYSQIKIRAVAGAVRSEDRVDF